MNFCTVTHRWRSTRKMMECKVQWYTRCVRIQLSFINVWCGSLLLFLAKIDFPANLWTEQQSQQAWAWRQMSEWNGDENIQNIKVNLQSFDVQCVNLSAGRATHSINSEIIGLINTQIIISQLCATSGATRECEQWAQKARHRSHSCMSITFLNGKERKKRRKFMNVLWCFAKAMAIKIDTRPCDSPGSNRIKWWDKMLGPRLGVLFVSASNDLRAFSRKTCSCSLIESIANVSWCWCCRRWQRCWWFLMPLLASKFCLLEKFFANINYRNEWRAQLKSARRMETKNKSLMVCDKRDEKSFTVFGPKCRVAAAGCSITWINFSKDFLSHSLLFMNFLLNNVIFIVITWALGYSPASRKYENSLRRTQLNKPKMANGTCIRTCRKCLGIA